MKTTELSWLQYTNPNIKLVKEGHQKHQPCSCIAMFLLTLAVAGSDVPFGITS